jgi:hypothetical protein
MELVLRKIQLKQTNQADFFFVFQQNLNFSIIDFFNNQIQGHQTKMFSKKVQ